MDVVLSEIEILVAELVPTCGALWDECKASQTETETPIATATPVESPTPAETPTAVAEFVYIVLDNARDTYLYRYEPSTDFAQADVVKMGYKDQNRPLYQFSLDTVPVNANVVRATLRLWVYGWSSEPLTATAHVLYVPFDAATWNEAMTGVSWAVAGCGGSGTDRDEEPTSVTRIYGIKSWVEIDLTNAVRRWLTYLPNYGVVLYSQGTASYQFTSAESADTAHRPKLEILCRNPDWE